MSRPPREPNNPEQSLELLLRGLKLPSFVARHQQVAVRAEKEGWSFGQYLHQLAEAEHEDRRIRRIERALRQSSLPAEKTLATLDLERFPTKVRRQIPTLCQGGFTERAENILAFGLPGRGKTHLLCAIGHELIQQGCRVLFVRAYHLVQRLLAAKRDLLLEKALQRLDVFDLVIVDDIGYVQQDRDEMEVLFTFFGERYERRSVAITSNLVFSQWDRIFKDPMTTAAAVDRLVHHSIILELSSRSYRRDQAQANNAKAPVDSPKEN
jgi:DNA replication protein DnaC